MVKRKIISALLLVVMVVSMVPFTAMADPFYNLWQRVDDGWVYWDANGHKASGWNKIGKTWYYFDPEDNLMLADQWLWEDNSKGQRVGYHFNSDGAMEKNKWIVWSETDSKNWMYLGADGATVIGWKRISKDWYWFDNELPEENLYYGVMARDRQVDNLYYVGSDGKMVTNKWVKVEDAPGYYTFWSYYDANGVMANKGWKKINKKWYWFASDGIAAIGTCKIMYSGTMKPFYFDEFNADLRTGWFHKTHNSETWYYAYPDTGVIACDTSVTYKGKVYKFDETGRCLNP
ncbi:Glucan-binding domain-containing protein (YG repeat) [Ruminococcaceae bacterium YRB3002]|nr:Glucan-binding domain-containing protein (YG repeat) [Ruminococcaceae bacterium YRB3002]